MALIEAAFAAGEAAETDRCAGIVQLSRAGEIDTDFRSIIHFIEGGEDLESIKARSHG